MTPVFDCERFTGEKGRSPRGERPMQLRLRGHGAPVIAFRSAGNFVGLDNLAIREGDIFQVREVLLRGILAVGHVRSDVHNDGVFKRDGEVMLHRASGGSAVELHFHLGQALSCGQSAEQQRGGFVDDLGDFERLVRTLAGGLA